MPAPPSLLAWIGWQLRAAGLALLTALGGGLLRAAWRRQLRLRALCLGPAVFACGLLCMATLAHRCGSAELWRESSWPVACGLLLAALTGAATCAAAAGGLAIYELEATWLAIGGGLWLLLSRPWGSLWGQRTPPWTPALGEAVFGPLWDRLLGLYLLAGLLVAVWGASCALSLGIGARGGRASRPTWGLEGFLAARSLARRRHTQLSATAQVATVGVGLGVAALIVVTAVMSGYQSEIEGRILRTNAHLVVQKYGADFAEAQSLLPKLLAVSGVAAAAPFAFNEAMLAAHGKSHTILLKGMAAAGKPVTDLAQQMCAQVTGQGSSASCQLPGPHEPPAAAGEQTGAPAGAEMYVGLSLFRALDLPLGASVQAMTPAGLAAGGHRAPKRERFVLAGVFASGMHEFDSHLVYVALPAAQALLGLGATVSGIELRLDEPRAHARVSRQVLDALGHYPYRTLDWRALNSSIFTALTLQKVVMFLLLSFIVVVASFNIASTLLMAVMQKSGQVAVLKSMGAQDLTVLRMFVLEGLAIGCVGCGLGLALGLGVATGLAKLELGIAADVYMVGSLTVALDWREILATVGLAFAICQVATIAPALRAAQLPVQRLFDEAS